MNRMLKVLLGTLWVVMSFASVVRAQTQNIFFQPPAYSGGAGGAQVGDLNGDGKADMVFADGTVLLGNQDGTLHAGPSWSATGLTLQNPYPSIALADFNGDGKLDLLIVEPQNTLLVLLGTGDGTFQKTPISTTTGAAVQQFFVADTNGDGRLDILLNVGSTPLVFLGNGDGTFKLAPIGSSSASSTWLGVGDFNRDGKIDILVSTSTQQLGVLLGNGDGTFQSSAVLSNLPGYYVGCLGGVVIGDLNGDGYPDVIATNLSSLSNGTYSAIALLSKGDGTFVSAGIVPAQSLSPNGGCAYTMALSDVDKDGKLDLVITYLDYVQILLGKGDGTFAPKSMYFVNDQGEPVVADFNGDGKLDIADSGLLLLGNGDGTFRGSSATLMPLPSNPPCLSSIVISDFDRDGNIDVACLQQANGSLALVVLFGDGAGVFPDVRTPPLLQTSGLAATLVAADVNGDGIPDLVVSIMDSNGMMSVDVLLSNGDRTFRPALLGAQVQGMAGPIVVADLNGDHKPDLALLDSTGYLQVFLGNGDGTFTQSNSYFTAAQAGSMVAADFNNDGNIDLVVGTGLGLGLLFGKGDGTFGPVNFFNSELTSVSLVADLNGDGVPDLMAGNQVLLGNGDGTFLLLPGQLPLVPSALADFNGDGRLDVLGTIPNGSQPTFTLGYTLGNGDGTFGSAVSLYPPRNSICPWTELSCIGRF